MTNDSIEITLLEYLDGTMPDDERNLFEQRLAGDSALRQALEELKILMTQLENLPETLAPPALDARFEAFLAREKKRALSPGIGKRLSALFARPKLEWELAAAVALLLIGVGFGWFWRTNQRQQAEISALRREMKATQRLLVLAMLEEPSASERIRAVNVLEKEQADPQITDALIRTLNVDGMTNVRMKAAQALGNFGHDPVVKQALINSLQTQQHPEVQIVLIDVLVALGEKRAVPSFQRMLRDKDLMDIVRKKAASGINALL